MEVITTLLLEQPVLSGSIAELLATLPTGAAPLLLIPDDEPLLHRSSVRLRPQKQELILALARGRSTRDIAALRQVRRDSVRRQLCNPYRKTDVHDQRVLLAWGLQHHRVALQPPRTSPAAVVIGVLDSHPGPN